jgi:hypothetical protein
MILRVALFNFLKYSILLRNTMDRTNQLNISYRINDSSFQKFNYLFPYHLFHFWMKTALKIHDRLCIFFQINFMHT